MVVGHGLIAGLFKDYKDNDDYLIFASGVSNSKEKNNQAFKRERELLTHYLKLNPRALFVYFSTCSIYDESLASEPYIAHKLQMEELVIKTRIKYYVFRLSNVVGIGGNANTIFNFLIDSIRNNVHFNLWQGATRNLLGVDDLYRLITYFLQTQECVNSILNIANRWDFSVLEIVETMEAYLGKKGSYTLEPKGKPVNIPINAIEEGLNSVIDENRKNTYIKEMLLKYYIEE